MEAMAMPEGPVTLFITHSNLTSMSAETKLPRTMTIGKLRDRLYMSTGTAPSAQALTLQDATGTPVAMLDDDTKTLGFYFPEDGMLLHVRRRWSTAGVCVVCLRP